MSGSGGTGPRIWLHIGRNKAGSTSLQDVFLAQREALAAAGLRYCLFGHLKDSVPGVPGFQSQIELADHARGGTERAYLISNEFMFGWPLDYTRSMATWLAGFDVRIIAYIRPYGAWIRSAYADAVKNGENSRDFDRYLDWMAPRISAWPYLEGWGEAFGWDRVRIRSIDPRDLAGGDLIGDCLAALGLDPALGTSPGRSNQAPDWPVIEMLRCLITRDDEAGWEPAGRRIADPLRALMESCLTETPVPPLDYLTAAQATRLAALYNRDLDLLAARTGVALQPDHPTGREREILPGFAQIPADLRSRWVDRAGRPEFRRDHPEAAAAAERLLGRI
jgi:hypothetical protein